MLGVFEMLVERLPVLADRRCGVLVTNAGIESQVLSHAPSVVREKVNRLLVAIVGARPRTALPEIVRREVFQKYLGRVVLIVATAIAG